MEQVSQPFTQPTISRATPSIASPNLIHLPPALLAATWLCGFLVILFVWYARWRQISATVRQAAPLREGREVVALRRLESIGEMPKRIEVRLSRASLEPGIFGITRPVLLWPEGISERLEDAHLEAILAHELWHVRRRDNLAAVMHMVVEAIFWFHPLVWWLGVRLVDEREQACDEEVLELGSDRHVYAESILKICEFCLESPLDCVSGVTGADLKKRIVRIMTERVARRLNFSGKLLLSVGGLVSVVVPVVFGLVNGTASRAESQSQNTSANAYVYEVASIKPNKSGSDYNSLRGSPDGFTATNITLRTLIREAYAVEDHQITQTPSWLNSERYDIQAKADKSTIEELQKLGPDERKLERQRMLQALLADRFKLSVHFETKQGPAYALVIAKNGPKLHEAKPGESYADGIKGFDGLPIGPHRTRMASGELTVQALPMATVAQLLSMHLGRTVLDETRLMGNYDFTLRWTPEQGETAVFNGPEGSQLRADSIPAEFSGPSIFAALQEQLGLKLESQKGPVEILVIDHIEKPSEN